MKKILTLFCLSFIIIANVKGQPTQGLVAYYPFNGNTNDESGNGHNGTIIGNPQFVNDRFGNSSSALSFDGIDDWIEINSSALFPADAITMCYWVNRNGNDISGLQNYISKEQSFQSYLYEDSTFASGFWLGSGGNWSSYSSGSYKVTNLNEWIFYAFTWDDNTKTANVYVNGNLVNTVTETNPNYYLRTSTLKMYLGRNGSSNVYHIEGFFDDIRIYDRALSSQEISELVTDVNNGQYEFNPIEFKLEQNYPNPFNPITNINFQIPEFSFVTLKVYDILGRAVSILINEEKPAGVYNVEFNAINLPSGVYLYQLRGKNFVETKKMLLLK